MRWLLPGLSLLATAASGCCGGDRCGVANDGGPMDFAVSLGVSSADATGLQPIPLGPTSELVPGAQGGFHVWLNYRLAGAPAGTQLKVKQTARRHADGRLMSQGERTFTLDDLDGEGAWSTSSPLPAFMCPTPIGLSLLEGALDFHFEVYDAAGTQVSASDGQTTPYCPEGDQAAFCARICSGQ